MPVNVVDIAVSLVICLFVVGSMAYILTRFFKRLKQIEIARWGNLSRPQSDDSIMETLRWLLKKKGVKGK